MTDVAGSLRWLVGISLPALLAVGCDQPANAPPGIPPPTAPVQHSFAPPSATPASGAAVPWTVAADPTPNALPPATGQFPFVVMEGDVTFPRAWPPLALVNRFKETRVVDLRSGKSLGTLVRESVHSPDVVSADGMHLAQCIGKKLTVYSLENSDAFTVEFEDRNFGPLVGLFFAGKNRIAAVQIGNTAVQVHVLDLKGAAVHTFRLGATGQGRLGSKAVGVSGGGKYLAAIVGGALTFHDLETGKCVGASPGPSEFSDGFTVCRELVFSPDGKRLAAVMIHKQQLTLLEWDATDGRLIEMKSAPVSIVGQEAFSVEQDEHPLAYLPNGGGWVVSGRLVWKRDAGFPEPSYFVAEDRRPRCLIDDEHVAAVVLDGAKRIIHKVPRAGITLAAADPPPVEPPKISPPSELPIEPTEVAWSMQADGATAPGEPQGIAAAGDFNQPLRLSRRPSPFAAAGLGHSYVIYNWLSGQEVGRLRAADDAPLPIWDVSPDGRRVLIASTTVRTDWPFYIWNVADQRPEWQVGQTLGRDGRHIEFIGPQQVLFSHVTDSGLRRMQVCNVAKRELEREFFTPPGAGAYLPHSQLATPGGRYSIAAFQRELVFMEIASGKLVGRVSLKHEDKEADEVFAPTVTADGARLRMLVSYADKLRVVACDLTTGKLTGRDVDAARFKSLAGSRIDSQSAAWLPNDVATLIYQQVAVQCSTGALAGPLGIAADAAVLPLPRNRFLLGQRDANMPGAAIVPLAIRPNAADKLASLAAELRTTPAVASNPVDTPRTPTLEPPTPKPAKNRPPWTAAIDPATSPAFTPVKKLDFTIGDSNRFNYFCSDRPSGFVGLHDEDTNKCTVLDLSSGKPVGKTLTFADSHEPATIDPGGNWVVQSVRYDRTDVLRVFQVQTGATKDIPLRGSFIDVEYIGFDAQQRVVGVIKHDNRRTLFVWPNSGGEPVKQLKLEEKRAGFSFQEIGCAISPGGKYLAAFSRDYLKIVDLFSDAPPQEAVIPFNKTREDIRVFGCEGIAFSHDGARLASMYHRNDAGYFAVWDLADGEPEQFRPFRKKIEARTRVSSNSEIGLSWLPDGETLVFLDNVLIDAPTGCPFWILDPDNIDLVRPVTSTMMLARGGVSETKMGWFTLPTDIPKARAAVRKAIPVNRPPLKQPDPADPPFVAKEISGGPPLDLPQPHAGLPELDVGKKNGQRVLRGVLSSTVAAVEQTYDYVSRNPGNSGEPDRNQNDEGPMTPENEITLETYDLATGKLQHQIAAPERTVLLDLSPDGSLLLTGDSMVLSPGYSRLDVWAPQIGKHALGWMPQPYGVDRTEVVQWAKFIDKKHVLTWHADQLMLWKLPELQRVYAVATSGTPAMSPNRRFFIDRKSGIVRDSLTGQGVLQLENVPDKFDELRDAIFSADGTAINGVSGKYGKLWVQRWDTRTGRRFSRFYIPEVPYTNVAAYGEHGLTLFNTDTGVAYLVQLEERRIAGYFKWLEKPARGADDALWTLGHTTGTFAMLRRMPIREIPPGKRHDTAPLRLPPDSKIGVIVNSDLPNAAELRRTLEEKVVADGFVLDPAAPFKISFEATTCQMPEPGRPESTTPGLLCRLATVSPGEGFRIHEVIERRRHDGVASFDAIAWLKERALVPAVFPEEWRTQYQLPLMDGK